MDYLAADPSADRGLDDPLVSDLLAASPDAVIAADAEGTIILASPAVEQLFGYRPDELVGRPVELLMPEAVRTAHVEHRRRFNAEPSARPMGVGLRLFGLRRDGTEFPIDVSLAPVANRGGGVVGAFVRDASEWVRAERRLQAVNQLNQALLAGDVVSDILAAAAHQARRLVDADQSWVVGADHRGGDGQVVVLAADGEGAEAVVGLRFPAPASLAGRAIRTGERLVEDDLAASPAASELARHLELGATLVEPLRQGDSSFGTLVVSRHRGRPPFDEADQQVVALFASAAAVALQLGEARAEVERLDLVTEHERIARDMHDTVIQRLFATGMGLQGALSLLSGPAAERVARAVDDLDATITEIRTTIFGLRHHADDVRGLRSQMLELVAEATPQLGRRPRLAFDGPVDTSVPPEVADQLLAVAREALSNVARHARASAVEVVVSVGPEGVTLTVLDDGVGPPTGPRAGSGLRNMAERAAALGGDFSLQPRSSGGSRLSWRVPAAGRTA